MATCAPAVTVAGRTRGPLRSSSGRAAVPRPRPACIRASATTDDSLSAAALESGRRAMVLSLSLAPLALWAPATVAAPAKAPAEKELLTARVVMTPTASSSASGTITLTQMVTENGRRFVRIAYDLAGLSPGKHGVNIHELGGVACADGSCTGLSYNPLRTPHGSPDALQKFGASAAHFVGEGAVYMRHVGDLGNITAGPDGRASGSFTDPLVQLDNTGREGKLRNVLGRSIVVRSGEDRFSLAKDDGDAGPILAYGTIAA